MRAILIGPDVSELQGDVDGASQSHHVAGDGTDFTVQVFQGCASARFNAVREKVIARCGFGHPANVTRHVDSRLARALVAGARSPLSITTPSSISA